jgi:hypothetical protein
MHFTPTGSSWINQVQRWFGYLTDQLIRRGVHKSVQFDPYACAANNAVDHRGNLALRQVARPRTSGPISLSGAWAGAEARVLRRDLGHHRQRLRARHPAARSRPAR